MKVASIAFLLVTTVSAGVARKRPNILLLLTDDQDVILGGTENQPFLRKHITEQGTNFKNYFVHTPVCCSSRSSIHSGKYIHNGGAVNNSLPGNCYGPAWRATTEKQTFAVYANQAGYRTGFAGKYLNNYGLPQANSSIPPGWDWWFGVATDINFFHSYYYDYTGIRSEDGQTQIPFAHGSDYAKDYLPDLIANRTLDTIRNFTASGDEPWLIVNAWTAPHGPFHPAPQYADLFPDIQAPRTPNYNASSIYQQQKHWLLRQELPLTDAIAAQIDLAHRLRQQTLQSVDSHIDQFVKLLEELDVLDNTIIIYTSDNGFQLGQHRIPMEKLHMYESDIRVPFLVRGPNVPKNIEVSDLTGNVDIAPTIYELVQDDTSQITFPEQFDGLSIFPIIPDNQPGKVQKRTDFLIDYHGNGVPPCGILNEFSADGTAASISENATFFPTCPIPADNFFAVDASNNTYKCLRTIDLAKGVDSTYCRFEDNENFLEYYDNAKDPWQLHNLAYNVNQDQFADLEQRLTFLKTCAGASCRGPAAALPIVPPPSPVDVPPSPVAITFPTPVKKPNRVKATTALKAAKTAKQTPVPKRTRSPRF